MPTVFDISVLRVKECHVMHKWFTIMFQGLQLCFKEEGLSDFGLEKLTETLMQNTFQPKRDASGPFIYSVDHCFSIRGQGTIMTGTVLNGTISVNDVSNINYID